MRVLFSTLLGFLVYMDQILWSGIFVDRKETRSSEAVFAVMCALQWRGST